MPTIKTRKVVIRDANFSVFVILYELNHPPSDDDFPSSSTERPTIDPSQILRPSCRFSLEVCTKLHSSTFAGMVGRPKESRTTTTYFLMGFGREPQEVPATTTVSFAKIPLDSKHSPSHTELTPRAKPGVSSNGVAVGRYRRMAWAVVRCDGCLEFESLRGERRLCGSGTRREKKH